MCAALQLVLREPRLAQDRAHGGEVPGLGAMGGAGDRNLLTREPEDVGRPGENERQRLERLGRGSQADVPLGVSPRLDNPAARVRYDVASPMYALDEAPTPHGDDRRVEQGIGRCGTFGFWGSIRQLTYSPARRIMRRA